jgi:hypothetical protein
MKFEDLMIILNTMALLFLAVTACAGTAVVWEHRTNGWMWCMEALLFFIVVRDARNLWHQILK